jgi:hypothetical protein
MNRDPNVSIVIAEQFPLLPVYPFGEFLQFLPIKLMNNKYQIFDGD